MGLDKRARAEQRALKLAKKREERRTGKFSFNRMLDAERFDELDSKHHFRRSAMERK